MKAAGGKPEREYLQILSVLLGYRQRQPSCASASCASVSHGGQEQEACTYQSRPVTKPVRLAASHCITGDVKH